MKTVILPWARPRLRRYKQACRRAPVTAHWFASSELCRGLRSLIVSLAAVVSLFISAVATAANCTAIADDLARQCCDRNLPRTAMRQNISLTVADDKGTVSNLAAELYWKKFADGRVRARVELSAPPRQNGTVVLLTERETDEDGALIEPEVVLYKPSERRDRLITVSAMSGEMLGTDFSYEDFAYFYGTDPDLKIVRLPDAQYAGRPVIVIESAPGDPEAAFDRGAAYSRVVTRFDSEQCVPLLTQFYEEDDELRKELIAEPDAIRLVDGRWIPHRLVMHDLFEDSRTLLFIEDIEFEPELKDRLFSRSSLKRGR